MLHTHRKTLDWVEFYVDNTFNYPSKAAGDIQFSFQVVEHGHVTQQFVTQRAGFNYSNGSEQLINIFDCLGDSVTWWLLNVLSRS